MADDESKRDQHFAAEVTKRFGVMPNFFWSASAAPGLIEELWAFAKSAYLDNPLPPLFKERLFVHLSRFCPVRYCIVRHAAFLIGQGRPSGDKRAPVETIAEVVDLLRRPVPDGAGLVAALKRLEAVSPAAEVPLPRTQLEEDLFDVLTMIFVAPSRSENCLAAVRSAFGERVFEILMAYLAFIRTAHYWTETHPDLAYEPDAKALLREHPELAELLLDDTEAERVRAGQELRKALDERDHFAKKLLASEERFRGFVEATSDVLYRMSPDWSEMHQLYGGGFVADTHTATRLWLEKYIHPDDQPRLMEAIQKAVRTKSVFELEHRVMRADGSFGWTLSRAAPVLDANGNIQEWMGAASDISARKHAEAALRESEERFRGIFENAATGIAILDLDGRFQSCNPAFSAMLGYSEPELRQFSFAELVHPEDRGTNLLQCERLATQEIPSFEIVIRYLRKDGKLSWADKYVSLLRDAAGKPTHFIALVTDITDRKSQEHRITLLMREVNHRSKNMLAVVQAVARQTLAANPEDFLDRFGKRIEALAANQDLLVGNAWKGASLDKLVRSQLAPFGDLISNRIELQGPPLFVSASAAQALGMALHELATNAGKYGALSGPEGRVEIAWCIQHDESGVEIFIMSWREQTAHPVTAPAKQGFGSLVIGSMTEYSLGAQVKVDFLATGLTWQLWCTAAQVVGDSVDPIRGAKTERPASSVASAGRPRVLVVEDEALVAIEIKHALTEAGFDVVGPVRSVSVALGLLNRCGCDAAVLDINLGGETSEAVATELTASQTPFVTLSGYSTEQHHSVFAGAPALRKPLRLQSLIAEIRKCTDQKDNNSIRRATPSVQ
ncbi:MAG: PAS domain S-box protein [Rhodomicrobium sp.]